MRAASRQKWRERDHIAYGKGELPRYDVVMGGLQGKGGRQSDPVRAMSVIPGTANEIDAFS